MIIKDAAYRLLGAMLDLIASLPPTTDHDQGAAMEIKLRQMADAEFIRLHEA